MEQHESFLGRGWSFPPTFHKNGNTGIEMVEYEEDIRESLEVLLTTTPGERVMLPEYGCNLQPYLFEPITNSRMYFLKDLIRTAIINFEPRIDLNDIEIDYTDYLEGVINIKLNYSIKTINTRFNLVFPFYKIEGTDIPRIYHKQVTQSIDS